MLIDAPPDCHKAVISVVETLNASLKFVILTHGHWDHVADAANISAYFNTSVYIHRGDYNIFIEPEKFFRGLTFRYEIPLKVEFIDDSSTIELGSNVFCVHHVPGHTNGHLALFNEKEGLLFPGDVLFAGSIGRTDLYGGSFEKLMNSISTKLLVLPGNSTVFPGHGPTTTIAREKMENVFLRST